MAYSRIRFEIQNSATMTLFQSTRSGGVLIRMSRERSGSKANEKGCDTDQKISMLLSGRMY